MKAIIIVALLSAWSGAVLAQSMPGSGAPADPWSGKVGLGFAAITGNAKSSSVAADIGVKYDAAPWHHEGTANGFRATATDQTTDLTSTTGDGGGHCRLDDADQEGGTQPDMHDQGQQQRACRHAAHGHVHGGHAAIHVLKPESGLPRPPDGAHTGST